MESLILRKQRLYYKYFADFIFIHINKCGGTSVESALGIPFAHMTAMEYIDKFGIKRWNKRVSFTIVRNPWDRTVSLYHYRVMTNQTNLGAEPIDFNEWVKLTYEEKIPKYYDKPKMFMPQVEWITDKDGTEVVDYVGKFEFLQHDFKIFCAKTGKPEILLPHLKISQRKPYKNYYSSESRDIVSDWFAKDIARFEYSF